MGQWDGGICVDRETKVSSGKVKFGEFFNPKLQIQKKLELLGSKGRRNGGGFLEEAISKQTI